MSKGRYSRMKGQRGEREFAKKLTTLGFPAHRGRQYHGRDDAPDVAGGIPGTHVEVKFVEKLNVRQAMEQAEEDAGEQIPYVAHRRRHKEWLITIKLTDLEEFCHIFANNKQKKKNA